MVASFPPSPLVRRVVVGVVALGLCIVAAGCVRILEPRQSNIRYYSLEGRFTPDTLASTDTTGLALGLRKVRLADYLDTPTMVTRRSPHEIHFAEFHRWSEGLPRAINRAVAARLEQSNLVRSTEVVPWMEDATFDYVVQLQVLRFEGNGPPPPEPEADDDAPIPTGHAHMAVRWEIRDPTTDAILARGITQDRRDGWPVDDYADLAAKLDAALAALADDIATRLRTLADASAAR
jgi:uncharacterized lipoprotein YmbA